MERKKEIRLIIILLLLLAGILVFVYFNEYDRNDKLVKENESLISLQEGYNDDLNAKGYTIDNPKVVIDPYKASPLTAMVMFETKESTLDIGTYFREVTQSKRCTILLYNIHQRDIKPL